MPIPHLSVFDAFATFSDYPYRWCGLCARMLTLAYRALQERPISKPEGNLTCTLIPGDGVGPELCNVVSEVFKVGQQTAGPAGHSCLPPPPHGQLSRALQSRPGVIIACGV